jgi:hypothetical protein
MTRRPALAAVGEIRDRLTKQIRSNRQANAAQADRFSLVEMGHVLKVVKLPKSGRIHLVDFSADRSAVFRVLYQARVRAEVVQAVARLGNGFAEEGESGNQGMVALTAP